MTHGAARIVGIASVSDYAQTMDTEPPDLDLVWAEARVRAILETIAADRLLTLRVPNGFTVLSTAAERRANWFPGGTDHIRVHAALRMPVVFHARDGRATTASHENLDGLRSWIVADCRRAAGRIEPVGWNVTPRNDPRPRRRGEPDQSWQVAAEFRVER